MELTDLIGRYNTLEAYYRNGRKPISPDQKDPMTEFYNYLKEHAAIINEFKPETSRNGLKLLLMQDIANDRLLSSDHLSSAFTILKTLVSDHQDISTLFWAFSKFSFTEPQSREFYNMVSQMFTSTLTRDLLPQYLNAFMILASHSYQEDQPVLYGSIMTLVTSRLDSIETLLHENDDTVTSQSIRLLTDLVSYTSTQILDTWRRDTYQHLLVDDDHLNYAVPKYAKYTVQDAADVLEMTTTIKGMLYRLNSQFLGSRDRFNSFNQILFGHILSMNHVENSLISFIFGREVKFHTSQENFDEAASWQHLKLSTYHSKVYDFNVQEIQKTLDLAKKTMRIRDILQLYQSLISLHAMSQHLKESILVWQEMKTTIEQLESPVDGFTNYYNWLMDSFVDIAASSLKNNNMKPIESVLDDYFCVISKTNSIPTGMLEKLKEWSVGEDKDHVTQQIDQILIAYRNRHPDT